MRNLPLFLLAIFMFSCSSTRRETRLDNKATSRVLSKSELTDKVGKVYLGLHPTDQKIVYIRGRDSIIEVPVAVDVVRDSIIKAQCPTLNLDSLKRALTRTITIIRTDTVKEPDLITIRLLEAVNTAYAKKEGQLTEVRDSNTILKKDLSRRTMWLYVSVLVSILVIGGLLYLLFRKKG